MFNEFERARGRRAASSAAPAPSYEVNGQEVRARDVQLLFADASTGAHSTALVSQGRIGALINAKPTDRRALLEEAAGITGLHSRRHEAELRLQGGRGQSRAPRRRHHHAGKPAPGAEEAGPPGRALSQHRRPDPPGRGRAAASAMAGGGRAAASRPMPPSPPPRPRSPRRPGTAAGAKRTRQADAATALPPLRQTEVEAAAELQRLTIAQASLEARGEAGPGRRRRGRAPAQPDRGRYRPRADAWPPMPPRADPAADRGARLPSRAPKARPRPWSRKPPRALAAAETDRRRDRGGAAEREPGAWPPARRARPRSTRRADELAQRLARLQPAARARSRPNARRVEASAAETMRRAWPPRRR